MKLFLRYSLPLTLFILALFWPTACKRVLEVEAPPKFINGDISGEIILPAGTSWNGDELKVVSPLGEHPVKDMKFDITQIEISHYKILMANYPNDDIALLAPQFSNQTEVEFSAESSAVALLMLNPISSSLNNPGKQKLADWFRKDELFGKLVQELELVIKNRRPIVDETNAAVFTLINQIQNKMTTSGGRMMEGPSQRISDTQDIGIVFNWGKNGPEDGSIKLTNDGSGLPYLVSIINENGVEVKRLNLGRVTVSPLSFDLRGEYSLDKLLAGFSPVGVNTLPLRHPEPQYYKFNTKGRYRVKVVNSKGDDNGSALQRDADIETIKALAYELFGSLDEALELVGINDCFNEFAASFILKESSFSIKGNLQPEEVSKVDAMRDFVIMMIESADKAYECMSEGARLADVVFSKKYFRNMLTILKYGAKAINLYERLGSGLNLGLMIKSAAYSTSYYEECVEFDITQHAALSYCAPDKVADATEPVPTSISTGDPHITTLDNARYSFMAAGEFIAIKSTSDNFEVQARQQEVPSKSSSGQVTFNTGVAVNTGSDVVCVYPPNRVLVNKQSIGFSFENYALANGGSIRKDGNELYIRNANGDQVEVKLFNADLDYYITLNANRKGKVRGIIGNYDGNAPNDLVTSAGQSVLNTYATLYPVFADSWRIKQAESLFAYDAGKTTESYTDKTFPRSQVTISAAQEAAARSICAQQGVTDPVTLQNCIMDVALTGDNSYAQRAEQSENNATLRNFSIGNFNNFRTDIGLYEAVLNADGVKFNDLNCSGTCSLPALYWKNKFDFSRGFETEIAFTSTKVNATSNDNSIGVCGIETASSSSPSVYSALVSAAFDATAQKRATARIAVASGQVNNSTTLLANVFDGQRHRLRVVVSRSSTGSSFNGDYKVYLDGSSTPAITGTYTQGQYFRNMLFPSIYGENVLIHNWTMKALL